MIAVAARLPAATSAHSSRPIEVEVQHTRPLTLPEAPKVAPAPVAPKVETKVAMRALPERRERIIPEREKEKERIDERESEPPGPTPVGPPPTITPERRGAVDLTLHALPGAGGSGIALPAAPAGTFGGSGPGVPRKEWHMRGDAGDPITGKIKETPVAKFPLEKVGPDEFVYKGGQFSAHISPDGTVSFDDKNIRDFNGTSGSFDLNDLISRGKKEDPYRYLKQEFLKATEAQRTELARKARAELVRASLQRLPSHLESIWGDRRRSARDRKDLIFNLWREAQTGDGEDGKAGAEARSIIEAFIRNRLPEGSEDAFTDEELSAYNRAGKQRFQPYK
jgi:hypothetical protein